MIYDVAEITRKLQADFGLFARGPLAQPSGNKATTAGLRVLVTELEELTQALEVKRGTMSDWLPDAGVVIWDRDFAAWKQRLAEYRAWLDAAHPNDRGQVLWTVTAPLLLGFYGGATSKLPQQPLDAVTPFSLANQLAEAEAWRKERYDLFFEDLKQGLKDIVTAIPAWVWIGMGASVVLAGAYVVRAMR